MKINTNDKENKNAHFTDQDNSNNGYICTKCGEPLTPENDVGGECQDSYEESITFDDED